MYFFVFSRRGLTKQGGNFCGKKEKKENSQNEGCDRRGKSIAHSKKMSKCKTVASS
jgi:hypothetical protein